LERKSWGALGIRREAYYLTTANYFLGPQNEEDDHDPELDDECELGAFSDFEPDDEDPDEEPDENSARVPPCVSQPLESTSSLATAFTDRIIDGPNIVSKELNFALIETVEADGQMTHLPRVSQNNVGAIKHLVGNATVTTVTGSGRRLQGILSKRSGWFRLPGATGFVKGFQVQFEDRLLPRDAGSIVRDSTTEVAYGHVIAIGGHQGHMAIIIPTAAVLDHLKSMMSEPQGQQTTPEGL
jgi:hypothetical protein